MHAGGNADVKVDADDTHNDNDGGHGDDDMEMAMQTTKFMWRMLGILS